MKKNKFKISVVIPTFNEEGNIEILIKKLLRVLGVYYDYEILFVDDGSHDKSLELIKRAQLKNKKIKFLSFSRNFGHQSALRAGLDYAEGDCVVSLDADLQHPIELIPKMIKKWQEGYDVVFTVRQEDHSLSILKRKSAKLFYWIINKVSSIKIESGAADFRLLDRSIVEVLKNINEGDLFLRGLIPWLGFKQTSLEYMPQKRNAGETKYTFKKMVKLALSGITGFSITPLRISTFFGFFFAIVSFCYGAYAIYIRLFTEQSVSGWVSILIAVLFIGSLQMIMIGILGEYLGKLFLESKKRPNYIIKEKSDE